MKSFIIQVFLLALLCQYSDSKSQKSKRHQKAQELQRIANATVDEVQDKHQNQISILRTKLKLAHDAKEKFSIQVIAEEQKLKSLEQKLFLNRSKLESYQSRIQLQKDEISKLSQQISSQSSELQKERREIQYDVLQINNVN